MNRGLLKRYKEMTITTNRVNVKLFETKTNIRVNEILYSKPV